MIRIVERRSGAIKCSIVKVPLWRSQLPDEFRKIVPVFLVPFPSAIGGKVKLVPPLQLSLRRQWHLARRLTANQITAHGNQRLAALRPKRSDNVSGARSPSEAGENCLLDLQCVHQGDDIERHPRLLAVAEGVKRKKFRRPETAEIRDDYPVSCGCQ